MNTATAVDPALIEKAKLWLGPTFDDETKAAVQSLLDSNPKELVESFYTDLDFGTGGLRGIMGVGSNRINKYTLGQATQGLSNYLHEQFPNTTIKVAIAHDSRNNSKSFARQVAEVLSANGIHAYLFSDLRPTPELSYAIRYLGCMSGIVLTASHNPKEYNGYKVYWNDGAQLVPPHDKAVIAHVRKVAFADIAFTPNNDLITYIDKEIDEAYLAEISKQSQSDLGKRDLKVVFTALHGTSITLLPEALKRSGFSQVSIVEEQATPDGNFPTVVSPNPEEAAALELAVAKADAEHADIVIGCDPDSDRVGIAVRDLNDQMVLLNGNQTGAVLLHYILSQLNAKGALPPNGFIAETVVTSDLLEKIGDGFGVETKKCLTGFKWIAEMIKDAEGTQQYIAGGEESYGYLIGDFVRDKDAITASVLLAEAAAHAKATGGSFFKTLLSIYLQHGYYLERLIALTKKGKDGLEEIQQMIEGYRKQPPRTLGGSTVTHILDYQAQTKTDLRSGEITKIELPASNFIQFITEEGDKVTARPSGTEPKIKFYFSVKGSLNSMADYAETTTALNGKIDGFVRDLGL